MVRVAAAAEITDLVPTKMIVAAAARMKDLQGLIPAAVMTTWCSRVLFRASLTWEHAAARTKRIMTTTAKENRYRSILSRRRAACFSALTYEKHNDRLLIVKMRQLFGYEKT